MSGYSAALCRGLIEALETLCQIITTEEGIPRLYAAASLKRGSRRRHALRRRLYSAALCRGLIEALDSDQRLRTRSRRIPRLYAAASLKRVSGPSDPERRDPVFRGFMPRPH